MAEHYRIKRANLVVADGENRYDGHKERIAETPPVEHVANDGESGDHHEENDAVN